MATTTNSAKVTLPADTQILITREFDASAEKVFRAHVDPELAARWMGPRDLATRIEEWDAVSEAMFSVRARL